MARPFNLSAGYEAAPAEQPASETLRAFLGGDGRVEALERYGPLAARILISQIFLLSGVMKIMDPAGTAAADGGAGHVLGPASSCRRPPRSSWRAASRSCSATRPGSGPWRCSCS